MIVRYSACTTRQMRGQMQVSWLNLPYYLASASAEGIVAMCELGDLVMRYYYCNGHFTVKV